MELWSKGLGTKTVNLSFKEAEMKDCGDRVVINGKMGPPVYWDYTVTMTEEDLSGVLYLAAQKGTISFLLGVKRRRSLYFIMVKQVMKIALGIGVGFVKRFGRRRKFSQVTEEVE